MSQRYQRQGFRRAALLTGFGPDQLVSEAPRMINPAMLTMMMCLFEGMFGSASHCVLRSRKIDWWNWLNFQSIDIFKIDCAR
jgi:hypothetical protein